MVDAQQVLALAVAGVDLLQRRRQLLALLARLSRLALDVLLADQRLQPQLAVGIAPEGREGLVVDAQDDRGLVVVGEVDVVDLTDLDARDLHVLAGDHEAAVVEDGTHAVAATVVVTAARGGHERAQQQADDQREDQLAPERHGVALIVWDGSQSTFADGPLSRNGAEPSAGTGAPVPGQRLRLLKLSGAPLPRSDAGLGS